MQQLYSTIVFILLDGEIGINCSNYATVVQYNCFILLDGEIGKPWNTI